MFHVKPIYHLMIYAGIGRFRSELVKRGTAARNDIGVAYAAYSTNILPMRIYNHICETLPKSMDTVDQISLKVVYLTSTLANNFFFNPLSLDF